MIFTGKHVDYRPGQTIESYCEKLVYYIMAEAIISRIDIHSTNDIAEIGSIMKRLKISGVGLSTIEEMKNKVHEAIEESQRTAGWSSGEVILNNLNFIERLFLITRFAI